MPNYRRHYVPGGTFFFTVVTDGRRPFLTSELARQCLRDAIEAERERHSFTVDAIVLLPDHLHTIWTLPEGDAGYSLRWAGIKATFTRLYLKAGGDDGVLSASRAKHRERAVWQRRFWEHTCRDEDDMKRLLDYVHWNPCKHGLVTRVADYPWSSFHRYVKLGEYDEEWGSNDPVPDWHDPEWE